jgi:uncharacterized protein YeaO (DUF488 family)
VAARIVRLGSARQAREGLRLGTVRRPPRGVPRAKFASGNWYDVWLPALAPSEAALKLGLRAKSVAEWKRFARRYRAEMKQPAARQALELLAALSRKTNFSVGCYCEDESRCHRSILRELLAEHGAHVLAD